MLAARASTEGGGISGIEGNDDLHFIDPLLSREHLDLWSGADRYCTGLSGLHNNAQHMTLHTYKEFPKYTLFNRLGPSYLLDGYPQDRIPHARPLQWWRGNVPHLVLTLDCFTDSVHWFFG